MKTVSGRSSFCRKRIGAYFIRGCLGQGAIAGFDRPTWLTCGAIEARPRRRAFVPSCCGRNGRHEQRKLTSLFPLRTGGIRLQLPLHRMWRRTSFLPSELLSSGLPRAYVFGDSPSPDVTSGASGRSGKAGAMIARRRKHTASTNHHPQS